MVEPLVADEPHTKGSDWVRMRKDEEGFFLAERKL